MKTYKLAGLLYKKSKNAFLLALELYNKPTIDYRTESFSILFSNAWELLLKAHIFQTNKGKRLSIFRKKVRNKKRESISLDECLNAVFSNSNDPVKRNIEYISEIRNEAAHLIIHALDPYFSRVFQAGVNNYAAYLFNWFGVDINETINPGLVSLISDKDRLPDMEVIRSKYSRDDFKSILGWIEKFDELNKLGDSATLSIRHKVAIVKNPKKADIVISSGSTGTESAVIIERTKDPDISHPYNRKKALIEIAQRIPSKKCPTTYEFDAFVWDKNYKKNGNTEYFYKGKYSGAGQYSEKFLDEFVNAITTDPRALAKSKKRYTTHRSKRGNGK